MVFREHFAQHNAECGSGGGAAEDDQGDGKALNQVS
jgi:hypothetical protein